MMNSSYLTAAIITLAAIAWIASGQFGTASTSAPPTTPAASSPETSPKTGPETRVQVVMRTAEPMVQELVLQGRTSAARSVELRNQVRGRIEEVLAEKGQPLRAGDPIVRLAAEGRHEALEQARTLLEQRRIEYEAARQLAARGFNSEIAHAQAHSAFDAARTTLRLAEIDLDHTIIRAPFDGVLDRRMVEVGDFLDTGKPVAVVVELNPLKAVGFVSERHVATLRLGAAGWIRPLAQEPRSGHIRYIAASADPVTRTFQVELEIPNPDLRLADGLTAQLRLPVAERRAHHLSPAMLTLADDGRVGVKLVDTTQRVRFVPVEVIARAEDGVWIAGLPDTVTVITVGQEFVIDGQHVVPVVTAGSGDGSNSGSNSGSTPPVPAAGKAAVPSGATP